LYISQNMIKGKVIQKLKDNFYKRIDKNDELQFLDSSTLNHALCLEIAEGTFENKEFLMRIYAIKFQKR